MQDQGLLPLLLVVLKGACCHFVKWPAYPYPTAQYRWLTPSSLSSVAQLQRPKPSSLSSTPTAAIYSQLPTPVAEPQQLGPSCQQA